ncbi:hypothetical protein QJU89_07750 [Pasteurella skyensis]|uniref:Uncharacterized protein n=1 Tax=Phocoenobacter skyensis TaxID=97481 RepID=A0AAJ6N9U9_9PAST|nr:hypothetical protein [Pasteurella skyensis]MDP8162975.1 hypothetical protein [Pasteurella skyensis]MDP8172873.1 hypothetical protein [Pasteurella skyensis]MDP8176681.1 hypothetical protein [Pasteurella skyensis]MDP8179373.1 hypothetical protein [Pasteurella skyensis]MDP8183585.1 hypothetical protein [Pasteurella skyensis]
MNTFYTKEDIIVADLYHYYYEWIDFLDFIFEPSEVIDNYSFIESDLKEKFVSVGWDQENNIGLIWIPPFAVGSIVLGGEQAFLEKYRPKQCEEGNLRTDWWTKGLLLFHVKNKSDRTSIILSPIELEIPNYGV